MSLIRKHGAVLLLLLILEVNLVSVSGQCCGVSSECKESLGPCNLIKKVTVQRSTKKT